MAPDAIVVTSIRPPAVVGALTAGLPATWRGSARTSPSRRGVPMPTALWLASSPAGIPTRAADGLDRVAALCDRNLVVRIGDDATRIGGWAGSGRLYGSGRGFQPTAPEAPQVGIEVAVTGGQRQQAGPGQGHAQNGIRAGGHHCSHPHVTGPVCRAFHISVGWVINPVPAPRPAARTVPAATRRTRTREAAGSP